MRRIEKDGKHSSATSLTKGYEPLVVDITQLLEAGCRQAARSINAIFTATYWQIGRRIVEFGQRGEKHAAYGGDHW
jgi:hypothetical protein